MQKDFFDYKKLINNMIFGRKLKQIIKLKIGFYKLKMKFLFLFIRLYEIIKIYIKHFKSLIGFIFLILKVF